MKKLLILWALAALIGCGGSNSSSNPFEGSYSGTWSDYIGSTTFNLTVDRNGGSSWQLGDNRIANGSIQNSGDTTLVHRYPRLILTGRPFDGTLRFQENGQIVTLLFD